MAQRWTPDSWRARTAKQIPAYPDLPRLAEVEATLAHYPPLVFAGEARSLKATLANVADGPRFPDAPGATVPSSFSRMRSRQASRARPGCCCRMSSS